ncbi:MAG: alkaline phosphatase [Tenuifilaceae bacterium]|jgi:alkaline phosphatase|nr:alkaline phosphatase [Tenuifilaceae bacterium]
MRIPKLLQALLVVLVTISITGCNSPTADKPAKYVFYFIGDGMGVQHITATQNFLASQEGYNGNNDLSFTKFPATGFVETFSQNRYITGSAAAGTALATGHKTSVNTIGLSYDHSDSLFSIAHFAKQNGYKVGVATSVSIDHATPAAFYAHQPDRGMYHEISHDLISAGFHYYAGGGFRDPKGERSVASRGSIFSRGDSLGFLFTSSMVVDDEMKKNYKSVVFSLESPASSSTLKYQIDNDDEDITLAQITKMGIDLLENPNGFFFMIEGGKIDWAAHDNDAATTIMDVVAFSDAVAVALEFYSKFPDETLIVVTSDHETGGLSVGNRERKYQSDVSMLARQKHSLEILSELVGEFKKQHNGRPTFNQLLSLLESDELLGLTFDELSVEHQSWLRDAYKASTANQTEAQKKVNKEKYGSADPIAVTSVKILNEMAGIGWTTYSHTASHVPLYAIGAGQDKFNGQIDNTDVPRIIAQVMGFTID